MVQQGSPILFVAKDRPESTLILSKCSRGQMGILSSHVHHVESIHVRYFDNLICGWTGVKVLFLLELIAYL